MDYFKIEYDFFLDENNEYPAVLSQYRRSPDEAIDVELLNHDRPFLGIIINLSSHVLTYWHGEHSGSLERDHYNFFFVPPALSRWLLKPKLNSILCIECQSDFLQQFVNEAPILNELLQNALLNRAVTLSINNPPLTSTMLDGIVELTKENHFVQMSRQTYVRSKAANLMLGGLINSQRHSTDASQAIDIAELHRIYQYMVDNLEHIRDTRPLISLSGMPEEELKAKFKALYGKSLIEALHEERLKRGEYLLIHSLMPVLEIGMHIGYTSRNAFSSAFHHRYGMYPKDFRKRFTKVGGNE